LTQHDHEGAVHALNTRTPKAKKKDWIDLYKEKLM